MYNIKLLNKISPSGLTKFPASLYAYGEEVENPDGILLRSADMHSMELPESVKAIARCGAGVNNIPVDKCSEAGVVVFNTPGANANAVKELIIAALLMSGRKIFPGMMWAQELKGKGDEVPALVEKGKAQFVGPELKGKKLGVIGLGAIGGLVANAASALGMEIYGYDPFLSVDAAWNLSSNVIHAKSLKEIYENCDFITLHLPYNKETKGYINSQSIAQMKHGVRILNFSRGELVDDDDMLAALEEKQVYCYVTDFPNEKVLGNKGVIALPHLGASTPESEDNCAEMAADQMCDFLENGNILNSVNLPNVSADRTAGCVRIGVIHKNSQGLISQISGGLGVNIENMTSKSKGDYAYTLFDLGAAVSQDILDNMQKVDGVVRVMNFN